MDNANWNSPAVWQAVNASRPSRSV